MEIRKMLYRKETKLVTLLLTSLLIATASASVYFGLTMKATVTTTAAPVVKFVSGNDSGSSAANALLSTDGTWVRLAGLKAYPNLTLTYEQAVNVTNTDSSAHNIRLSHVSISPAGWAAANFTSISFKICNVAGTTLATLTYTVTGSGASSAWSSPSPTGYQSLPGSNTTWSIKVEIVTKPSATAAVVISIDMTLDVQQ